MFNRAVFGLLLEIAELSVFSVRYGLVINVGWEGYGDIGDFSSPLGIFPVVTPLEWALFCVKDIVPV